MHVSKYAVCTFAIVIPVEKKEFQNDSLTFDIRRERRKERMKEKFESKMWSKKLENFLYISIFKKNFFHILFYTKLEKVFTYEMIFYTCKITQNINDVIK